ncbi:MAG TPA: HlyD family secretion protein [Burkholderiales bacterium]|nr:HlyD family secretion protein [Burkholderiales bacterium]
MRSSLLRRLKRNITFANSVIFIGAITALLYIFSYLFPVTDNAFVVNNVRPVAALVKGYVTNVYIKNGDNVKKGQKLFTVFDKPYRYTVEQYEADLAAAKSKLNTLQKTLERDEQVSQNQQEIYTRLAQDDDKYQKAYKINAVSLMTLQNSEQETKGAKASLAASQKQIEIDQSSIQTQKKEIASLEAKLKNAQVDLDLTTVYAENDGIIQNFFLSVGTPVNVNQPLFSFIDTSEVYFQANFNETDLRKVHKGSKVLIMPRTYFAQKIFHGVVVSDYWSANRQLTDNRSQIQNVTNENQWVLLPQRLPVQIKVLDLDDKYPLRVGTSAYVYIETE